MAKKKKRAAKRKSKAIVATRMSSPDAARSLSLWSKNPDGFIGAEKSNDRAQVYFPNLETATDISSYSRLELTRNARFLERNNGFARGVVKTGASWVSGIMPRAATSDEAWNDLADAAFARRATNKNAWDRAGRLTLPQMQTALVRSMLRDGDVFVVLTESESGGAMFRVYESHQVGNRRNGDEKASQWWDGVRTDKHGRPMRYRFLQKKRGSREAGGFKDIGAENVIHLYDPENFGGTRGVSALSHAVANLLDTQETQRWIKSGIISASQIGYVRTRKEGSIDPGAFGSQLRTERRATSVVNSPDESGNTIDAGISVMDLHEGTMVPNLGANEDLKLLHDTRPHPNQVEFLDYLKRDIAAGMGLPMEVVWDMGALGGANTRHIMVQAQRWIDRQQNDLIANFISRTWVYTLAKEIKRGALEEPADPDWWSKIAYTRPARMSVDFGRDGKLYEEQLNSGNLSRTTYFGWQGRDREIEDRKIVAEVKSQMEICEEMGVPYEVAFPGRGLVVGDNTQTGQDDD